MTFEGLAFSEFGKRAFCVYLRGSQERAGRCLSLVSYRSSLQRPVLGMSAGVILMNKQGRGEDGTEVKHQFSKLWLRSSSARYSNVTKNKYLNLQKLSLVPETS